MEAEVERYEILSDMEDFCRNSLDGEDDDFFEDYEYSKQEILNFCSKFKVAIGKMDKSNVFKDNLQLFGSTLSPAEEDIFFYEIAVPFYENWKDLLGPEAKTNAEFMEMTVEEMHELVSEAESIVRILDNFYGYSYFDNEKQNK